jgi:hypothetical protein
LQIKINNRHICELQPKQSKQTEKMQMRTKNMNTNNKTKKVAILAILIAAATLTNQNTLQAVRRYVGFSITPSGAIATYPGTNAGLTSALAVAGVADTVFIAKGLTFYLDAELTVDEYIIGGCDPAGDGSLGDINILPH